MTRLRQAPAFPQAAATHNVLRNFPWAYDPLKGKITYLQGGPKVAPKSQVALQLCERQGLRGISLI